MPDSQAVETIRVLRRKPLKLLALGCGFTAVGIWMIVDGAMLGWIVLVFALGIPVAIRQLLLPGWVRIGHEAFDVCQVSGKVRRYEFDRCSEFFVWKVPTARRAQTVGFDYRYEPGCERRATDVNKRSFGFSETIADTYELKPSELAERLNRARERAVDRAAGATAPDDD